MRKEILQHLNAFISMRKNMPIPDGMVMFEQWLLDNGEFFDKLEDPSAIDEEFRVIKECYSNAARLITEFELSSDEYVYVEGMAVRHSLGIPMDHAWLVNVETREVLDPTWRLDGDDSATYFGIPYTFEALAEELLRRKVYGLHSDGCMYNSDLMKRDINEVRAWKKETENV